MLLVLAHGAGAGQKHPFMVTMARGLAARGIDVATFDFPYMQQKRKVPDKAPALEAAFRDAIAEARSTLTPEHAVFIGGKSMGGRIATQVAAQWAERTDGGADLQVAAHTAAARPTPVAGADLPIGAHTAAAPAPTVAGADLQVGPCHGIVALGYPLHPPGRPDQLRVAHLPAIQAPVLIVQGERDAFGTPGELRRAIDSMRAPVTMHVVDGGDHSLRVPRSAGRSQAQVYDDVLDAIAAWMASVTPIA